MKSGQAACVCSKQDTLRRCWPRKVCRQTRLGRNIWRRNYLWIFALLALSWNLKVYLHPLPARDFNAFIDRATVGVIPGWLVFVAGVFFNAAIAIFAIGTVRLREATGEVLPRHQFSLRPLQRMTGWTRAATGTARTTVRAKRARQRVRSSTATGEFRKIDISETPDRENRGQRSEVSGQNLGSEI